MSALELPSLDSAQWRTSRHSLHALSRLLGAVRAELAPPQKHWWHVALQCSAVGLGTGPMPVAEQSMELELDLVRHSLVIRSSHFGEVAVIPLTAQSMTGLHEALEAAFHSLGLVLPGRAREVVGETREVFAYDNAAVREYWRVLAWLDGVFRRFKGQLPEESSPVQFFPHHFDLSLSWFSGGRLAAGDDPAQALQEEQMSFGFVSGDETISEPYFYATAFPEPPALEAMELPHGAHWHARDWRGVVLPYARLRSVGHPEELLLAYLRTVQAGGSALMSRSTAGSTVSGY